MKRVKERDGQCETALPTSLRRYLPRSPTTPEEMETLRRRAWRRDGVLSLREGDDRLTWPERELLRQLGDRLYGGRERCGTSMAEAAVADETTDGAMSGREGA